MGNYELLLETYHRSLLLGKCKTKGDFARLLGITSTTLSRAFAKNEKYLTPSLIEKLQKMHDEMDVENLPALAHIDAHARELLKDDEHEDVEDYENENEDEENVNTLPLLPINAVAGYNGLDEAGVTLAECPQYSVPDFFSVNAEFLIRVSGSSMYPKYSSGDILACRRVREITFLQWGKIYVIDSQQGMMVKRLFEIDGEPDLVLCKSDNEDYPPFRLPKDEIRSLSIVVGAIRLE